MHRSLFTGCFAVLLLLIATLSFAEPVKEASAPTYSLPHRTHQGFSSQTAEADTLRYLKHALRSSAKIDRDGFNAKLMQKDLSQMVKELTELLQPVDATLEEN